MNIYILKWTAQESISYLGSILSVHRTMEGATRALVQAARSLESSNWRRTDSGISLQSMLECPPRKKEDIRRYNCRYEFQAMCEDLRKKMELDIESMEVVE